MVQIFDYKNYINSIKISPDEYLLPLFEVIVNAIQGIEDKEETEKGMISVKAIRDVQNTLIEVTQPAYSPIIGFEVYDNGIGFVESRYKAFKVAFTDFNAKKGCRGVGRYTVAACFGSMEIESTFYENDEWHKRSFRFDRFNGISSEKIEICSKSDKKELKTIVRLNNYRTNFLDYIKEKKVELDIIAENIINHCLLYFIDGSIPQIRLYDESTRKNPIFLDDFCRTVIKVDKQSEPLKIPKIKSDFNLNYIRNYSNRTHSFHLCANKREVGTKTTISKYIPSFEQSLVDDQQKKYYISVYVTGKFLDEKANNQRNEFSIPLRKEDKKDWVDIISIEELLTNISNDVRNKYSSYIESADKEKSDRIQNYILNSKKPRLVHKHLLCIDKIFDDIPGNATDERLEAELAKKVFLLEQKRTKDFNRVFNKKKYDKEEFHRIVTEVLREEAAFSKDKLADLIVRRKSVIKLFQQYLDWRDDKNYMLEEDLHNIIFTMGAETNSMPNNYHNLWLLDERLVSHGYTNSDKQFRTNKHIETTDSSMKPDLLMYDIPWAFSDNPNNINTLIVFEFKRPGRDMNTNDDRKLDSQVIKYFEKLMESKATNDKGVFLNIQKNTPKYGYVICDLHNELEEYNKDWNGFKPTPHKTLYKINSDLNMYIEVMSYKIMIDFAEKRQFAFFQALGIDNL